MARKVKPSAAAESSVASPPSGPILSRVLGHEAVVRTLLDALARGRLPSTLLFSGPVGVGKRLTALGLAQCLVCERAKSVEAQGRGELSSAEQLACGECGPCLRVARQQSESVLLVEPQGAGIKIEQAQEILQFIVLRQLGRARIVIINDAHLLNPQAGNALLKSLEEPPSGTYFILVTANSGATLSTIRSRSQVVRFQSLPDDVVKHLTGAEDWIVRSAQGSVEAALRMRENSDEWAGLRRLAIAALEGLGSGRLPPVMEDVKERFKDRVAALFITQIWSRTLRDFAVLAAVDHVDDSRLLLPDVAAMSRQGARLPLAWIQQLADLAVNLEQDIQRNVDRTLALETFSLSVAGAYAGREPRPVLSF